MSSDRSPGAPPAPPLALDEPSLQSELHAAWAPSELDRTAHDRILSEALAVPALDSELGEHLRAAWAPQELPVARQRRWVEWALEASNAPPDEHELALADSLRRALDEGSDHADGQLLGELKAAWRGVPGAARRKAPPIGLASSALREAVPPPAALRRPPNAARAPGNVVFVTFGGMAAVAAAAAVLLMVLRPTAHPGTGAAQALAENASSEAVAAGATSRVPYLSRSTASLFTQPLEVGKTRERVERIATLRRRELRANRFAHWGVE